MDSTQRDTSTRQLRRAFASTRAILVTVRPDDFDKPTPCASWNVRALVNHVIGSARWATATVASSGEVTDADYAAGDFLASYDDSVARALAAFTVHGALDRTVRLPFGDDTGAALMGLAANDQFTHGWDLARAIGRDTNLDPGLAKELLAQAQLAIGAAHRGPDGAALFGPIVEPPDGASPADRLAAYLGRSV